MPHMPGMMLVTVNALKALGDSATIKELDQKVIELEGVRDDEQAITVGRKRVLNRLNYYLAWARTHLKAGKALENSSHGVWTLTDIGKAITGLGETEAILRQRRREVTERAHAKKSAAETTKPDVTLSEVINLEVADDWKSSLLAKLGDMTPDAFERLSQRLLRESGFTRVEVRGKSGDGGIDGMGVLRVNLVSFQVYFQCKRWKGSVGSKEIRDFRGALQGRADKGLFITTGHFTNRASDEATREGAIAIDLIDGDRLCDLLKERRLGVDIEMIESVQINSDWFEKL